MTQHLISARLGPADGIAIPTAVGEVCTHVDFAPDGKRLGRGIGQALSDLNKHNVFPTELGLDLVLLASTVYFADTRIARGTQSQDSWTREIRIVVPVSDVERWLAAAPVLKRLLDFLSGDLWTLNFRVRPTQFAQAVTARPAGASHVFDMVSLFSGGLDSLIGAIDLIEQGSTPLLISHAAEGATSDSQKACFDALRRQYEGRAFARLRFWLNLANLCVPNVAPEHTTRARSFLFFSLGALAGTGLHEKFTLRVPENGLIAVNVPLDVLRLGSLSTRTTHPFYIARWNELLETLGIVGRIENPYWSRTKGEMIASCANQDLLRTLVPASISCSSPTKGRWKGRGIEQCGYCVPCIIRRAALEAAWGRGHDPTTYTIQDLGAKALDTRSAAGEQSRSFQFALARLRARPGLEQFLVHKAGSLNDEPGRVAELADVHRRGMEEVGSLLSNVVTKPT